MFVACVLVLSVDYCAGGCSGKPRRAGEAVLNCTSDVHPHVGPTAITCKLVGETQAPITGAKVSLEADMSHAGMSPAYGEAKEASPGMYTGTLDLNMRGDWVVTAQAVLPDGEILEQVTKIPNLQAN